MFVHIVAGNRVDKAGIARIIISFDDKMLKKGKNPDYKQKM
jgi:hypothetical protein